MERYEQVVQLIYDAIGEINRTLDSHKTLERLPETVLLGNGKLDSLEFLNFTIAVEERVEQIFHKAISVIDTALLADESDQLTVAILAGRIAALVNNEARAEQRAQPYGAGQ